MQINILEYLENTVKKHPNQIAVEDNENTITFRNFHQRSLQLSTLILQHQNVSNIPLAVFLPKSIDTLCAFTAILYSGNFYVPLDVKNPRERLHAIIRNINPALIITNKKHLPLLKDLVSSENILLIEELTEFLPITKTNHTHRIDTDPAYLINTSGSTGTPKAVGISHRSIIDYIDWAIATYPISPNTIIGNQAPFCFDNSVLDIYLCFATGAKLVLIPEEYFAFPLKLLEYLEHKQINHIFWVPSLLNNIAALDMLAVRKPNLHNILFAGEVMPTSTLNYWHHYYPNALFSNLYGPTEITVDCTYYIVDRQFKSDEPLPIGKPCRNTDILVLDENNQLITSPEISGELCVRGTSLALGYYNDFSKTETSFVQNPLNPHFPERIYRSGDIVHYNQNNELIFEGRKDLQIKHLGYRIELGEIETALGAISSLINKCVIYNFKRDRLVLFYESPSEISLRELIVTLNSKLPKYMIPTELRRLEHLPLTPNGKINRQILSKIVEEE